MLGLRILLWLHWLLASFWQLFERATQSMSPPIQFCFPSGSKLIRMILEIYHSQMLFAKRDSVEAGHLMLQSVERWTCAHVLQEIRRFPVLMKLPDGSMQVHASVLQAISAQATHAKPHGHELSAPRKLEICSGFTLPLFHFTLLFLNLQWQQAFAFKYGPSAAGF